MMKIISGSTGSGKTYRSINLAKELGRFIYCSPTTALTLDTYDQYADHKFDRIVVRGNSAGGRERHLFTNYQSVANMQRLDAYQTVIIDEAHHLGGDWQQQIASIIHEAVAQGLNVLLITATLNFKPSMMIEWEEFNFEVFPLESKATFPIERISESEFWERVKSGIPSIGFRKFKGDCESISPYTELEERDQPEFRSVTSSNTPFEVLETCRNFNALRGERLLLSTKTLGQGVNLSCENLLIEFNEWDTPEDRRQMIGRLGRMGLTKQGTRLTLCHSFEEEDLNIEVKDIDIDLEDDDFDVFDWCHNKFKIRSCYSRFLNSVESGKIEISTREAISQVDTEYDNIAEFLETSPKIEGLERALEGLRDAREILCIEGVANR